MTIDTCIDCENYVFCDSNNVGYQSNKCKDLMAETNKCYLCPKEYQSINDLESHLETIHGLDMKTRIDPSCEIRLIDCNYCRMKILCDHGAKKKMSENGLLSDKSKVYREDPEKGKRS